MQVMSTTIHIINTLKNHITARITAIVQEYVE